MQNDELSMQDEEKKYDGLILRSAFCALTSAFLLCLCWFAHFSYFRQMGFYEDDHWFAARTVAWSPHELTGWIADQVRFFPRPQGRPIGFILGDVIPFICYHIGGIPVMFLAGWIIFATNTLLVFTLLRRCLIAPLPLIGAIAFVLFPADTTRPFLCHAHILQPSITFMLLGCHLQMHERWRRRWFAYVFAACALLTYETALLPFAVFPLLHEKADRSGAARFALHLVILGSITLALFVVRRDGSESRAVLADTTKLEIVQKIWTGTGIGLDTLLEVSQSRAQQGADDYNLNRSSQAFLMTWAIVMVLVIFVQTFQRQRGYRWLLAIATCRAAVFCIAGLTISYIFCFTHYPPYYQEGRLTSTHLAATLPVAVLMAVVACLPTVLLPRMLGALVTASVAGLYFTTLFASARDEQVGYAQIWKARQQLWTQIADLCPDMTESTLIAFGGHVARPAYYMGTASWSDYLVLQQMFDFSSSHFKRDPMAAYFPATTENVATWQNNITRYGDGILIWNDSPFGVRSTQPVFDHNLILLHCDEYGNVIRQFGTVQIASQPFHLKDLPKTSVPFPRLPMYGILTGRSS